MNVLFLVPYPLDETPSQRFRFEQYFELLFQEGHSWRVQSFLGKQDWREFSQPGKLLSKVIALFTGFTRRLSILFHLRSYHFVFIHREAAPLGPPVIEWVIARIFRKRIIYDFDDAIWLTDQQHESYLFKRLKWRSKVASICEWSYKVSCGNSFLCDFALQFNKCVIRNPTTVETDKLHAPITNPHKGNGSLVIGWTGSHSTLKYLKLVEPVLQGFRTRYPMVEFLVIADREPALTINPLTFKSWDVNTEIEDLARIDIGIMPLPDDEWSKGKCGFKALQYMALEIPTVASRVGANTGIIDHGVNGFLASTDDEWIHYLALLADNKSLREAIGKSGRKKVVDQFSVRANSSTFLSLFR